MLNVNFEKPRLWIINKHEAHPVSNIIPNERYEAVCISRAVNVKELYMAKTSAMSAGITFNSFSLIIMTYKRKRPEYSFR